jgi:tetratricopeptide (TPR) repeat protein
MDWSYVLHVLFGDRKLNVKLLACLVLPLILLGVGVHFLHGFQVSRNADFLLRRAQKAKDEGNLKEQKKYLELYIGYVGNDPKAQAEFALVTNELTGPNSRTGQQWALTLMEQAVRKEGVPGNLVTELRRQIVRRAFDVRRPDLAKPQLEHLLREDPTDAELQFQLGQCHQYSRPPDYPEAIRRFDKAREYSRKMIKAYVSLADIYGLQMSPPQPKMAEKVLEDLVERNSGTALAYLARADYIRRSNKQAFLDSQLKRDVKRASDLAPNDADVIYWVALVAREEKDYATAERELDRGLKLHPGNTLLLDARAAVKRARGDHLGASQDIIDRLKSTPEKTRDLPEVRWIEAREWIQQGDYAKADEMIARLRREGYPAPRLDFLGAFKHVRKGDLLQAVPILEQITADGKLGPDLSLRCYLLLGSIYEQLGQHADRLRVYEQAVGLNLSSSEAYKGRALARVAAGQFEGALEDCKWLLSRGEAKDNPATLLVRVLLVKTLDQPRADRTWGVVQAALNDAFKETPDSVEVVILQAEVFLHQDLADEARRLLERELAKRLQEWERKKRDGSAAREKDLLDLYHALLVWADQRQPEEAPKILAQAQEKLPDSAGLRVLQAGWWGRQSGREALAQLDKLAQGLDRYSAAEQARLLKVLADGFSRHGDRRAAELWLQLLKLQPEDLRHRLFVYELAWQAGNEEKTREILGDIPRVEGPAGAIWRYRDASERLLQVRKLGNRTGEAEARQRKELLAEARKLLAQVHQIRSDWPAAWIREAQVAELEGNAEKALECYREAIRHGDRQPQVIARTVQLLHQAKNFAEANRVMEQLREKHPASIDLTRMDAMQSLLAQDFQRALELARKAVETQPTYQNYIWLGKVNWAANKQDEAERAVRKALEIAPDRPEGWVVLVECLQRMNRLDDAKKVLAEEAPSKLPSTVAFLVLGHCYEMLGMPVEAEQSYLRSANANFTDLNHVRQVISFYLRRNQVLKAEPHLRRLMDPKEGASEEVVRSARRTLAFHLAQYGSSRLFPEAEKLIEQNLQEKPTLEDRRTKAAILAMRGNRRADAIRVYEEILADPASTPDDRFRLAQLYEADEKPDRADEHLLKLIESQPNNSLVLIHYLRGLLRRNEVKKAETWLPALERLQPEAFVSIEMKARLRKAQNRLDDALTVLDQFVEEKKDAAITAQAAAVLEEWGQVKPAEALFHQAVVQSKQPQAVWVLVDFLFRQGRLAEALAEVDKKRAELPPETVASRCVEMLFRGKPAEADYATVAGWIEAFRKKNPQSVVLLLQQATARDLQGKYKDAVETYREVLKLDKNNIIALNNLAWLLALGPAGGKAKEPFDLIEQAIRIGGDVPDMLDTRAMVRLKMGQAEQAVEDMQEVVDRAPSASRYFHLALACKKANRAAEAAEHLKKAQSMGLKPTVLHALERKDYYQLTGEPEPK